MTNKNVTFEDVVLFVRKCIVNNKLYISGRNTHMELSIQVRKENKSYDYVNMYMYKNLTSSGENEISNELFIDTNRGLFSIKNLTKKEISLFSVLVEDVIEQEMYNGINEFNSFFDEELPPSSIDDLQDEEDE